MCTAEKYRLIEILINPGWKHGFLHDRAVDVRYRARAKLRDRCVRAEYRYSLGRNISHASGSSNDSSHNTFRLTFFRATPSKPATPSHPTSSSSSPSTTMAGRKVHGHETISATFYKRMPRMDAIANTMAKLSSRLSKARPRMRSMLGQRFALPSTAGYTLFPTGPRWARMASTLAWSMVLVSTNWCLTSEI